MRTIEGEAMVTTTGVLMLPTPPGLVPGSYHVVVVIEERVSGVEQRVRPALPEAWTQLFSTIDTIAAAPPVGSHSATSEIMQSRR